MLRTYQRSTVSSDTYHTSIMNREVTVEEGVASMNEQVGKILNQ